MQGAHQIRWIFRLNLSFSFVFRFAPKFQPVIWFLCTMHSGSSQLRNRFSECPIQNHWQKCRCDVYLVVHNYWRFFFRYGRIGLQQYVCNFQMSAVSEVQNGIEACGVYACGVPFGNNIGWVPSYDRILVLSRRYPSTLVFYKPLTSINALSIDSFEFLIGFISLAFLDQNWNRNT